MSDLVVFLLIFVVIGVFFVWFHLMLGSLIRPRTAKMADPEKFTIYECGEPTIGSAWVQFDLRFYVIALLFVIFDVEAALLFPWAVVFGKTATVANRNVPVEQRTAVLDEIVPPQEQVDGVKQAFQSDQRPVEQGAANLAWLAFLDVIVFFGVLLVGFAYLWKRGDLHWVRSLAAEGAPPMPVAQAEKSVLVGAGSASE